MKTFLLTTLAVIVLLATGGCGDDPRMERAMALEADGRLGAANALYRSIIAERPNDVDALREIAVNLYVAGRYDDALYYQQRVVALDEHDGQTRVELGFNYLNHQGDVPAAVAALRSAAQVDPSPRNLVFLAQALLEDDQAGEAEYILREAIDVDPSYARSYQILAVLLDREGRAGDLTELVGAAADRGVLLEGDTYELHDQKS